MPMEHNLRRGLAAVTLVLLTALFPPGVEGQTDAPTIEKIAFTDDLGTDYYSYKLGSVIEVTVTFSEVVAVTGTPQIDLPIESMTRQADYQSGPPSTDLVFRYTVVDTDEDTDGLRINANALKLNGGSIKKNNADIDADLTHEEHSDQWIRAVDGITPVLWTAAAHGALLVLTYSEAIWLYSRTPAGDYEVMVNNTARGVSAVSISDRAVTLTLASAVTPTDQVTVSYTVGTRPIQDKAGNAVAALTDQTVTTSAPYVSSLEISSMPAALHTYAGGEVIELTVTFSESVTITGTPQILLSFDSTGSYERAAPHVSGSGTPVLVFRYAVAEGIDRFTATILYLLGYDVPMVGDKDPDGLSIAADALQMHDGTIRDSDNHDAILILDALTDAGNHKVDGVWPWLVFTDDPPTVSGATVTLHYDEMLDEDSEPPFGAFAVTVGGAPGEVTGVSIDNRTVTLTLRTPVGASDEVRLNYTAPTGTEATPLQDLVGNKAQDVAGQVVRNDTPPPPPPSPPGGTGGGSGGRGGGSRPQDRHGNTPTQASEISLGMPNWTAAITGQINPADDVDYFTLTLSHDGVLVVETTGRTDTVGTVWQAGEVIATSDSGGIRQNFRLSVRVEAGAVVIAVAGNGRRTGSYTLETTLLVGFLENLGRTSFQSGIGLISGWVCTAEVVEIELDGAPHEAAYGTERLDTASACGDSDNGFGLAFNWNLLGDGEHEVVAYVDDVELARATVTVTTLGEEFLQGAEGVCVVENFPRMDESVALVWQQSSQNFVLADGPQLVGLPSTPAASLTGVLENPSPYSFQSGIGLISGWVCEAEVVEIRLGELTPQVAAYGTERRDTDRACGDSDNGFGLLFNWNLLGDGEHEVVAWVDGEELGRTTVQVTTLGEEFAQGVEGMCVAENFPRPGETVTLEWQPASQNFVITDIERVGRGGEED